MALKMQLSENNIDASFSHVTTFLATHNIFLLRMYLIPLCLAHGQNAAYTCQITGAQKHELNK